MQSFPSLDLQQRTGDIQRAAIQSPVLLTSHGKPIIIIMSAEEFRRLKTAAGEPVPIEVQETGTTLRGREDPLGDDLSEFGTAVEQMIADVKSGRTKAAVDAELEVVRRAYGRAAR